MTKYLLVKHPGHDGPWLTIKTRREYLERRKTIRKDKPEHEIALRLKLIGIVKKPLPMGLRSAYAAREKAYAAREKAYAAWVQAYAAREKAYAAREKAYAAWEKANAAWEKANAAWEKAYAAWEKANAVWEKAIDSPRGVAFHAQVCGCKWSPKTRDILVANAPRDGSDG